MREALDMFTTFLYSGATNVDKMLKIYDREGNYFVGFHEFAKSIILGDRKYYRESQSKIVNLFNCGQDKNSSHFTSVRLLSLLLSYMQESSSEGQGFINLNELYAAFLDIFDNETDITKSINRLLRKQLIQVDTRSTESIKGASYIRITSSGWYYIKYLVRAFAYLDLIFQDTPINDQNIAKNLQQSIIDLDRIQDTHEYISDRLAVRFDRVETFLDYLIKEEQAEISNYFINDSKGILGTIFMPDIREQYLIERNWIEERIRNRTEIQPDDKLKLGDKLPDYPLTEIEPEEEEP
jgi:hypothetical protein